MSTKLAPMLLGALLLAGCAGTPPGGGSLVGREFLSVSVTVDGAGRPLVAGTRIRLSFDGRALSASAGCNILGAGYRIEGGRLVVDQVGMTEMGCDPARHAQDEWLSELLSSRPSVSLDGPDLTLVSGATRLTLLDREVAEPDLPLVGTEWVLVSLIEGETAMSVPGGVVSKITFNADGSVGLEPGCNSGGGRYEVIDGTIRFSGLLLTRMACPGPPDEVEAAVLAVIDDKEVEFRIQSGTLWLEAGARGLQYDGR